MWIVAFICILSLAFLLVCLRGFHAALEHRYTFRTILTTIEERDAIQGLRREAQLIPFPRRREQMHMVDKTQTHIAHL